jgi:tRNA A37 N6-isopentenylltransferase MiaA
VAATRQLAKRQFTWLRSTNAVVFEPHAAGTLAAIAEAVARAVALARSMPAS